MGISFDHINLRKSPKTRKKVYTQLGQSSNIYINEMLDTTYVAYRKIRISGPVVLTEQDEVITDNFRDKKAGVGNSTAAWRVDTGRDRRGLQPCHVAWHHREWRPWALAQVGQSEPTVSRRGQSRLIAQDSAESSPCPTPTPEPTASRTSSQTTKGWVQSNI